MKFLYACLIILGIALATTVSIVLTAHGIWLPLVVVLGACSYGFAKIGCASHD